MRVLARCVVVLCLSVTSGTVAWTESEQAPARRSLSASERQNFVTAWARQRLKLTDIRRDIAEGGVLRIDSTPTYFINGVRLPSGNLPPELFELAITLELSSAP